MEISHINILPNGERKEICTSPEVTQRLVPATAEADSNSKPPRIIQLHREVILDGAALISQGHSIVIIK